MWQGRVHEVIPPRGKIEYSDAAVSHKKLHPGDPDRNLRIFEKMLSGGEGLDPRQQFYYGRELFYHERYDDAAAVFEAFLDSGQGWTENCIDACRLLSQCYRAAGQNNEPPLAMETAKPKHPAHPASKRARRKQSGYSRTLAGTQRRKLPQADNMRPNPIRSLTQTSLHTIQTWFGKAMIQRLCPPCSGALHMTNRGLKPAVISANCLWNAGNGKLRPGGTSGQRKQSGRIPAAVLSAWTAMDLSHIYSYASAMTGWAGTI